MAEIKVGILIGLNRLYITLKITQHESDGLYQKQGKLLLEQK